MIEFGFYFPVALLLVALLLCLDTYTAWRTPRAPRKIERKRDRRTAWVFSTKDRTGSGGREFVPHSD